MSTPTLGRWVTPAACRASETRLFFPEPGETETVDSARNVCGHCPVIRACRRWALAHPEERGIWGGLTEAERHSVRRRRQGRRG